MGNSTSTENSTQVSTKLQTHSNASSNSVSTSTSSSNNTLIATPVPSGEKSSSTVSSVQSSPNTNTNDSDSLVGKDATRWRNAFGSKNPRSVSGSFTCPVCSVILYTNDDSAVNQHVEGCLVKALNKSNVTSTSTSTSSTSTNSNPPTSNRNPSQTISISTVQSPSTFQITKPPQLVSTQSTPALSSSFTPITTLSPTQNQDRFKDQPPLFPEPEIDESDPFAVRCPYASCAKLMEAKDFYDHVMALHSAAPSQCHSCPVCTIMGVNSFKPTKDTNLYRHVRNNHYDLSQANNRSTSTSSSRGNNRSHSVSNVKPASSTIRSSTGGSGTTKSPSGTNTGTSSPISSSPKIVKEDFPADVLNMYKNLGSRYVVDTLKQDMESECTICYEEFVEGDTIARMDCFCIFHKKCIDRWFKKSNKCPLHKDEFL